MTHEQRLPRQPTVPPGDHSPLGFFWVRVPLSTLLPIPEASVTPTPKLRYGQTVSPLRLWSPTPGHLPSTPCPSPFGHTAWRWWDQPPCFVDTCGPSPWVSLTPVWGWPMWPCHYTMLGHPAAGAQLRQLAAALWTTWHPAEASVPGCGPPTMERWSGRGVRWAFPPASCLSPVSPRVGSCVGSGAPRLVFTGISTQISSTSCHHLAS